VSSAADLTLLTAADQAVLLPCAVARLSAAAGTRILGVSHLRLRRHGLPWRRQSLSLL
jgi:hypothetical protein